MENLLETLRSQHAEMIRLLTAADKNCAQKTNDHSPVVFALDDFKKVFVDHIYLENKYIYPPLLEKEKTTRADLVSAKIFLGEIAQIQNDVIAFLNKYADQERIEKNFASFRNELSEMIKLLKTRIQLEEEGVFALYP